MNDKKFNQLLEQYLDGELSRPELDAFRQALLDSPARLRAFRFERRLRAAQNIAVIRAPRLAFALPTAGRIHRFSTMLANAAVLVFVFGLSFQASEPAAIESVLRTQRPAATAPAANTTNGAATTAASLQDDADASPYPDSFMETGGNLSAELPADEYGFVRL
jgi:hypothetical protein